MSDTPRTDARVQELFELQEDENAHVVDAEFARQLEREAEAWKAKCHKAWEKDDESTGRAMRAEFLVQRLQCLMVEMRVGDQEEREAAWTEYQTLFAH
jgi:uncharacterized protein YdaU (DUF1376 family)